MTIDQRRSTASAFLEKLRSDDRVLLDWITMPKNDPAALGTFIAATLGLETTPTADELQQMATEMDAAMRVPDAGAPCAVGFFLTQQAEKAA